MLFRLMVAFVVVPLVELYLLFKLSGVTSPALTIGIVILTGVVGSALARREGTAAWRRFHDALGTGRPPGREIQDGLMIVFAAALLLTPGLLTDLLGFTLLIPQGRDAIRRYLLPRVIGNFKVVQVGFGSKAPEDSAGRSATDDPGTLEGTYRPGASATDGTPNR